MLRRASCIALVLAGACVQSRPTRPVLDVRPDYAEVRRIVENLQSEGLGREILTREIDSSLAPLQRQIEDLDHKLGSADAERARLEMMNHKLTDEITRLEGALEVERKRVKVQPEELATLDQKLGERLEARIQATLDAVKDAAKSVETARAADRTAAKEAAAASDKAIGALRTELEAAVAAQREAVAKAAAAETKAAEELTKLRADLAQQIATTGKAAAESRDGEATRATAALAERLSKLEAALAEARNAEPGVRRAELDEALAELTKTLETAHAKSLAGELEKQRTERQVLAEALEKSQAEKLAALDTRVSELAALETRVAGLAALDTRVAELATKISAVPVPPAGGEDVAKEHAKQLATLRADLDARLTTLESADAAPSDAVRTALLETRTAVTLEVETKLSEFADKQARLVAGRFDALGKQLAAIEARLAEPREAPASPEAAAAQIAVTALRGDVDKIAQRVADQEERRKLDATDVSMQLGALVDNVSELGRRLAALEVRLAAAPSTTHGDRKAGDPGATAPERGDRSGAAGDNAQPVDLWSQPWIWGPGLAVLGLLLFLLFRRDPREAAAGIEGQDDAGRVAVGGDAEQEVFVIQDDFHLLDDEDPNVAADRALEDEPQPQPQPTPAEEAVRAAAPVAVTPRANGEPAPRVQTLRVPSELTIPGGDDAVRNLLECDPRVLVEPGPRVEQRPDGSLSIRFYVRGNVALRDADDLSQTCWRLAANGAPR